MFWKEFFHVFENILADFDISTRYIYVRTSNGFWFYGVIFNVVSGYVDPGGRFGKGIIRLLLDCLSIEFFRR